MKHFYLFIAFLSVTILGCQADYRLQTNDLSEISVSISGKITCPSHLIPMMSDVKVLLKSSTSFEQTIRPNANGTFSFSGLENGEDYTLTISRDHNPNLNMAAMSMTEFNEVMLGTRRLSTTLETLAADFNLDGSIDPTDALYFRRMSLNIIPNNSLWRFVSTDLVNGTNTAARSGGINRLALKTLTHNAINCDFVLLRLGNVTLNECQ
jgi:hypothetical protein